MYKRVIWTVVLAIECCSAVAASEATASVFAASAESATFRSYTRARAVLDRAIVAHGGLDKIESLRNLTVEYEGTRRMLNQSRRATGEVDREPSGGKLVVDREGNRMFALSTNSYPGIGSFGGAWAIEGTEGYHWEPLRNHHGAEIMGKLSGADTDGPWAFIPRWMPVLLLTEAKANNTNLRWVDAFQRDGSSFEAISFVQRDRSLLVLVFDSAINLLAGFETIRDDGVFGDVSELVRFHDYVTIAGVELPTRRTEYLNGQVARELTLRFTANAVLDDALFELPAGYSLPAEDAHEAGPRIRRLGEGVYLDEHMGGVMIVEFDSFLVVVECPGNYWMSQSTIDAVHAAIPDKPIRYVVPSHTHGDHGGGARAYFHAGTTLITTPGHVGFYEALAKIPQTIRPDPLAASQRSPRLEVFAGKRVIREGSQVMELYDVGPNAHSEELTVVYLPRQRILWQADLVFNPFTGDAINAAMPIGVDFAKKLKELGIADYDLMVEAHHSRVITRDQLRLALELAGFEGFP
jgi:glyoxylase-like metal-dependent hydrolase (beta-lactamase superfamily II)